MEEKKTNWGTLALIGAAVWYLFLRRPAEGEGEQIPPSGGQIPQIAIGPVAWQTDYMPGDPTTCHYTIRNLSNFTATVYARLWLGYQIAGVTWYDCSNRTWRAITLAPNAQIELVNTTVVVNINAPLGPKVGRLYVYAAQVETSQLLAFQNLANACTIIARIPQVPIPQVSILAQTWI